MGYHEIGRTNESSEDNRLTYGVPRSPRSLSSPTSAPSFIQPSVIHGALGMPDISSPPRPLHIGHDDVFEQEANSIARSFSNVSHRDRNEGTHYLHITKSIAIQRKCAKCEQAEEQTLRRSPEGGTEATAEAAGDEPAPAAETAPDTPTAEQAPTPTEQTPAEPSAETKGGATLLVDDDAAQIGPGQMRKTEFLAALRESVCATANEAMAPTGQSTENCPWMEYWFTQMADKDAAHVEKAIHKFAPETAGVSTAQEYIPLVAARVRRSVEQWAKTGEISGLPEGITPDIPGLGALGGLAAGLGGTFFKARPGGARVVSDPGAIRNRLGVGSPLPESARSRMESAFGLSFSQVRIHTDPNAASLSDQLNARAFTVGEHVAFGPGEYQPGTLVGDALLAHELAHVVQQGGATNASSPMPKGEGEYNSIEQDADRSAVGAVASLWGTAQGGLSRITREAAPNLRSGLGLHRCAGTGAKAAGESVKKPACTAPSAKDWKASFAATEAMPADMQPRAKLDLVQQALCPLATTEVKLAGTKHPDAVDPEDYDPYPVINFDVGLNGKQSWPREGTRCKGASPPTEGCNTKPLGNNYGYNFRDGSALYVVLGPAALSADTPAYTQRNAEHEIFLATQYTATEAKRGKAPKFPDDAELDAWTRDFVGYFHLLGWKARGPASGGGAPIYFGEGWQKLVDRYYESTDTSDDARKKTEDRLVEYFNSPPSSDASAGRRGHPTDSAGVKEVFLLWLDRREAENPDRKLIKALRARKLAP
jgi:hypothetical protein